MHDHFVIVGWHWCQCQDPECEFLCSKARFEWRRILFSTVSTREGLP